MTIQKTKGFTLIELLVVIAIIGILSAVVLASLNQARDQGTNAAIQSELASMRAEAQLSANDNNGKYSKVCTDGESPKDLFDAAAGKGQSGTCVDSADEWAAEVELNDSAGYFCVDDKGAGSTTNSSTIDDAAGSEDYTCGG